jgi:hypothetical protein
MLETEHQCSVCTGSVFTRYDAKIDIRAWERAASKFHELAIYVLQRILCRHFRVFSDVLPRNPAEAALPFWISHLGQTFMHRDIGLARWSADSTGFLRRS